MMNKQQTSYKGIWKYALLIPEIILIVSFHSILKAENQDINPSQSQTEATAKGDTIYNFVEVMPEFPGGEQGMMKWLAENIKYPAQEQGIHGRMVVRFRVMPDGSVQDVELMRAIDPSLDAEVIRAIESMPKWTPGKKNGELVAVYYTLPIVFRLSDDEQVRDKCSTKENAIEKNDPQEVVDTKKTNLTAEGSTIYGIVEVMPEFPGGEQAMLKFLAETIKYPSKAQEKGIQGKLIVRFVVMFDGSVQDVELMKSVDPLLDAEAIRVVESMPKWTPGKKDGEPVAVYYTLPILFRSNDGKPAQKTKKR